MTYFIIHPRGNKNIVSVICLENPKDIRDYDRVSMREFIDEKEADKFCELYAQTHNKVIEYD